MTERSRTRGWYHVWLRVGIAVIALSAIAASAEALYSLALRTGYGTWTAASLPVALDVMAAVAALAWLAPVAARRCRGYARGLCLVAVALAIAGNAGHKSMALYAVDTPWPVVVSVAAIPPAALAAAVHLAVLLAADADHREAQDSTAKAAASIESDPIEGSSIAPTPVGTSASTDPVEGPPIATADSPPTPPAAAGVDRGGDRRESSPTEAEPAPASAGPAHRSIEDLRAELAAAIASPAVEVDPTSAESIRRALRCGPQRARQLRDEHTTTTAIEPNQSSPIEARPLAPIGTGH
ncbi:DUF2637 domain-containing protein [Haloechinothrix alba]|uniref:DUF2637 domain-containing protein n=1 Tax=Haloechinothrix alba TaxID=664784 RepID=UPI0015950E44|nr:DUF2637 domain-containing protein [Haloechinothrix alba]